MANRRPTFCSRARSASMIFWPPMGSANAPHLQWKLESGPASWGVTDRPSPSARPGDSPNVDDTATPAPAAADFLRNSRLFNAGTSSCGLRSPPPDGPPTGYGSAHGPGIWWGSTLDRMLRYVASAMRG